MIIGMMIWLDFFGNLGSTLFALQQDPGAFAAMTWSIYIPSMILGLAMGVKFCHLLNNEWTDKDHETRVSFYRWYFIVKICLTTVIYIISYFVVNKWLDDNCEKYAHPEQTNADCDAVKGAAASRMIGSEVITICI